MPVRIVLADDHLLVRAGLCKLLEAVPGVDVVGQANDGEQVLAQVGALLPDMVLMDIAMPRINGLDACAKITTQHPGIRVVILSMHREQQYVRRALQVGASGYLLKDSAPSELRVALECVNAGQTYLSPAVAAGILGDLRHDTRAQGAAEPQLTPRQREVLTLVAKGLSTKEVARTLDLSIKTVDTHRSNLMNLLDIHDVTGLVRYAIRTGLISSSA